MKRGIPGVNYEAAEMAVAKLTNYQGNGNIRPGMQMYIGENDDTIEFKGGSNFLNESIDNDFFQFTITNNIASDQALYLTPGLVYAPGQTPVLGTLRTGTFNSIANTANAFTAASTSSRSIELFHAFITFNPTRIVRMRVQATTSLQANKQAEIITQNPFKDEGSTPIRPGKIVGGDTYNDKRFEYNFAVQVDNQRQIKYTLAASEVLTIDLEVGAVYNTAKSLNDKAALAHNNFARAVQVENMQRYAGNRNRG